MTFMTARPRNACFVRVEPRQLALLSNAETSSRLRHVRDNSAAVREAAMESMNRAARAVFYV
jgi:hypothetical protein